MKLNDFVELLTGPRAGEYARVICVFGGYVTALLSDMVAVSVPVTEVRALEVAT